MLTINLQTEDLVFRDISKENLKDVLELFNQNENNMYATGIDRKMSIIDMNEKYLEVLVNSHEFFVGIFLNSDEYVDSSQLVGVLKGRVDYENCDEAWISSMLIDAKFQHKGIGKNATNEFIRFLNRSYDIKRIFIGILSGNEIGKKFWQRMGFSYIRTIEQYIKLNNHTEDFIIMRKNVS